MMLFGDHHLKQCWWFFIYPKKKWLSLWSHYEMMKGNKFYVLYIDGCIIFDNRVESGIKSTVVQGQIEDHVNFGRVSKKLKVNQKYFHIFH